MERAAALGHLDAAASALGLPLAEAHRDGAAATLVRYAGYAAALDEEAPDRGPGRSLGAGGCALEEGPVRAAAGAVRELAASVREGRVSAVSLAEAALSRARADQSGAFTRLFPERALRDAAAVDALVAKGGDPGPLAGVPFAVKDLFDMGGEVTLAGSRSRAILPQSATRPSLPC